MKTLILSALSIAILWGGEARAQSPSPVSNTELSKELENPVSRVITLPLRYEAQFSPSRSTGSRRWRRSTPNGRQSSRSRACSRATCKALAASGEKGLLEIMAATHAGMTTEEFAKIVDRLDRRPRGIRASTAPTPSWSTSRCSSCSPTCAPTASRPSSSPAAASSSCGLAERVYGIPPEQVVGSSGVVKFELGATASPCSSRKPKSSSSTTARASRSASTASSAAARSSPSATPTATSRCCEWTAAGDGRALHGHRAPHRRRARMGLRPQLAHRQARQGARRGRREGWTVVDMKRDWRVIFPAAP